MRPRAETAVVVLGRAAGEDRDCLLQEGSYYLKAEERNMLALAKKYFKKLVVLLNIGNVIDFSWVDEFAPNAVLLLWQAAWRRQRLRQALIGRSLAFGQADDDHR